MFDFSVVHPSAKSYRQYAQRPLGTATRAESMKSEQYAARCREQGHLFYPAILECFGAIGVKCKDLVGKIDEEAALNGVPKIHGVRVKTYILEPSLSDSRGNAMILIEGGKKARARLRA